MFHPESDCICEYWNVILSLAEFLVKNLNIIVLDFSL